MNLNNIRIPQHSQARHLVAKLIMPDKIIAGAYVIRNKQTSTVLHAKNPFREIEVTVETHDERTHFNSQVWWIEPLPNYEDSEGEKSLVYSITCPASGKSLDMPPEAGLIPSSTNDFIT